MEATLWICPPSMGGCGAYYGSTYTRDLSSEVNRKSSMSNSVGEAPGKIIGTRDECGICKTRGKKVLRVPIVVRIPDELVVSIAGSLPAADPAELIIDAPA